MRACEVLACLLLAQSWQTTTADGTNYTTTADAGVVTTYTPLTPGANTTVETTTAGASYTGQSTTPGADTTGQTTAGASYTGQSTTPGAAATGQTTTAGASYTGQSTTPGAAATGQTSTAAASYTGQSTTPGAAATGQTTTAAASYTGQSTTPGPAATGQTTTAGASYTGQSTTPGAAATGQTTSAAGLTSRMNLHVMGQSGKFTLYTDQQGRSGGITVNIDALRELDASGNAVGTAGSVKHSINTFASQNFAIAPTQVVTIGSGLAAERVSFEATLGGNVGIVKIDTFVMLEGGTVGNGQESWSVRAGDVKWNIELSNWSWCGCSQGGSAQVGDMIDIDIAVKGLASGSLAGKSLSLGEGAAMQLANLVSIDGALVNLTAGYPQFNIQGSSTVVTFRFPKFTDRAVYDPVMTTSSLVQDPTATTTAGAGAGTTYTPLPAVTGQTTAAGAPYTGQSTTPGPAATGQTTAAGAPYTGPSTTPGPAATGQTTAAGAPYTGQSTTPGGAATSETTTAGLEPQSAAGRALPGARLLACATAAWATWSM